MKSGMQVLSYYCSEGFIFYQETFFFFSFSLFDEEKVEKILRKTPRHQDGIQDVVLMPLVSVQLLFCNYFLTTIRTWEKNVYLMLKWSSHTGSTWVLGEPFI